MSEQKQVTFSEALSVWLRVGLMSFGGPAAQIALMHRMLVEERKWLGERQFLNALNYCMLLPGPEAQQLATYAGWLLHGVRGGLVAGLLFIVPGALVLLGLSAVYAVYGETVWVAGLFFGVKAAVLAVVVEALLRISRRILHAPMWLVVAATAFVLIFFLAVPFPLIVLGAALLGYAGAKWWPHVFVQGKAADAATAANYSAVPTWGRALRVVGLCGVLWISPLIAIWAFAGPDSVFMQIGLFFSKMAVVTFGGAYAVLAYVAQQAVETFGWLAPGEMLDGLGLAETTPGPLILVLEFVGFLAAYRDATAGTASALVAGLAGAGLTLWVTFVPCFLWIFLGAPYVERIGQNKMLSGALAAITAAVVGVILNLAIWFALHVLFAEVREIWAGALRLYIPDWGSIDLAALCLAVAVMVAMFRFHIGLGYVLSGCAAAGLAWTLL